MNFIEILLALAIYPGELNVIPMYQASTQATNENGPPKPLTYFKDKLMYNYAWSRNGNRLACVRGDESSDVVMIQGFN
jgi:hypothetical protein